MPDTGPYLEVESKGEYASEAERWNNELTASEQTFRNWRDLCREIKQRYQLEDDDSASLTGERRYNILWSNVETLLPAIYSKEPTPVVKRRFRDPDPVARTAAEVMERAISNEMEADERRGKGLSNVLKLATKENLLFARGIGWIRYEPQMGTDEQGNEIVIGEACPVDFVSMEDFLHSPHKTWSEVAAKGWVARKVMMTREEGVKRFGDVFQDVPVSEVMFEEEMYGGDNQQVIKVATVWEIWDAETKSVIWLNRGDIGKVLDKKPDLLGLDGFFPCPMPIYGTLKCNSLIPIPDYKQYKELARQMDFLTKRIDNLVSQLRVAGFFDAGVAGISQLLLNDKSADKLVGVQNMAQIIGKGSGGGTVTGIIQLLPLDTIAKALIAAYDARERAKQALYEISGIADVLRGVVDPREKLGQSELKSRNASMRIDQRRNSVEHFSRDLIRMKAEIIAEHYAPEQIRIVSGYDTMPQISEMRRMGQHEEVEQLFLRSVDLIKNERLRGFKVEVETNSTVMMNDQEEKQQRIEFLTAAGQFIEQALPAAEQAPQLGPLLGQMLLFGVRGFRTGRQLESAFEDAINNMLMQPPEQEQGDDGEAAKAQAEQEKIQMEMQAKQQEMGMNAQIKQAEAKTKMEQMAAKHQMEMAKMQAEMEKMQMEMAVEVKKLEVDLTKMEEQRDMAREKALLEVAKPNPQSGSST